MEIQHEQSRAERIRHVMGMTMHNIRLHHQIVEKRVDGICNGIHHSQHRMLMCLSKLGKTASQKNIAQHMNISPACVARTLKALSQSGLVERAEAESDSRCNEVSLSETGIKLVQDSCRMFQALDLEMYADFSDEEIAQLTALMEKLNQNLADMESACVDKQ